jgi:uncharacterized protein (DUF885 family)
VQGSFDEFTNELFVEEVQSDTLTLNYALADPEQYGIEEKPVTLGEFSIEQMEKEISLSENYLKRLNRFRYDELTESQKLTYDILKNYLELGISDGDYLYYTECLGPTTGLQAQLPILLAEYNFYTRDDIDDYIELLPGVYDYFKEITAFEREKSDRGLFMSDAVADRIIEQCKAFIEQPEENFLINYFNEKISGYDNLTKKEIASYQEKNRAGVMNYVIPAYELLIDTLEELKGTGVNKAGLYYYPEGQAYYEYLAKSYTGSGKTMDEMSEMLDTAIGDGVLQITKISLANPDIIQEYDDFTSFPITDPEEILDDLKTDILTEFPDPVPVQCEIKYVDESLSEYLSPAMYLVPAIDEYTNNNIYINGDDEATLSKIYTTVAHEGYPGHLYQCVYFRSQDPAPIRNVMNFLGYDEGWATYVEHYSYHLAGIDETLADFLEVNSAVILFMYARADIGIHYEGWTQKKAVTYINSFVGDEETSKSIYDTLLEEPAIYLPYAVGYLEIKELRAKAEKELGDQFDPKEFHEFLLDIGPAQFNVIDNYIDEWLQTEAN